jgi:hypothetical protein
MGKKGDYPGPLIEDIHLGQNSIASIGYNINNIILLI